MPPKMPQPRIPPPTLDGKTYLRATIGQLLTAAGSVVAIALMIFGVAHKILSQMDVIQHSLATLSTGTAALITIHDEKDIWNEVSILNPQFIRPDISKIYLQNHAK